MTGARAFGTLADGRGVQAVTLAAGELRARILTRGAVLQDLRLAGVPWPLLLGSDLLAAYEGPMEWFGAVVGPVANRIAGARLTAAGQVWHLPANDGPNCLHGGPEGTWAQLWQIADLAPDRVALQLDLARGAGGLPGARRIGATYRILPPATLELRLWAETDRPTPMNLAHHPYWSLDGRPDTGGHWLRVAAAHLLPTDAAGLPTGEIRPLAGDPRDLRALRRLDALPRLDHNYCLSNAPRPLTEAAELTGASGVRLRLATTAPGLQVYDGAGLNTAPFPGLTGQPYGPRAGVALEPQYWPDAPHHAGFPDILLQPGSRWEQITTYRFDRTDPTGDTRPTS
ncbi:hypothetical protein CCR83_09170 [Rhodobacter veldkampii DSM 11550]|uniref:Galactose mutarotase n=1 Tax=Phaeovulum veldkampii DSM 11550 TaxID=1185920 RepID=A0A2T4JLS8_9RHOB|nr:aldose epimerase family protein [Phaeovulum veldkampii]MBK5946597.1 hypothetical protein [Phaeovulum veldkampii DSM 11550]PTE18838.1 galactose mutarotase [Phaeovulum veldkampii DSM 11550]TDQ59929.1 aldose 1-epimerase [Phaeovulum veldkampii DSM 11550]